ncbi:MAG: hypothetical protein PVJ80_15070 [Gemmatimonadota bacterium]|jgi:hypothetical protein
MSKLERWLTLVANLSVVVGIIFLAAEMRQNTAAVQAQTRDAITEKPMSYMGWAATSPELAAAHAAVQRGEVSALSEAELWMYRWFVIAQFREWENSYYQFQQGLFTVAEFEGRAAVWRSQLLAEGGGRVFRNAWSASREGFSPPFRAEIDRIVAEVEQAQ